MISCLHTSPKHIVPVVTVPVSLIGRLGPHDMSHTNVHWLRGRQSWQLIGQEMLLHHSVVMAAVGMNFPVEKAQDEQGGFPLYFFMYYNPSAFKRQCMNPRIPDHNVSHAPKPTVRHQSVYLRD